MGRQHADGIGVVRRADALPRYLYALQRWHDLLMVEPSCRCKLDAPRAPDEQRDAECLLKSAHLFANRALGHAQLISGAGEAPQAGN